MSMGEFLLRMGRRSCSRIAPASRGGTPRPGRCSDVSRGWHTVGRAVGTSWPGSRRTARPSSGRAGGCSSAGMWSPANRFHRTSTMRGHHSDVSSIGVSLDGKWIATRRLRRPDQVWDCATPAGLYVVPGPLVVNIPNIDFSPDGRFVYGPSPDDGTVSKWEVPQPAGRSSGSSSRPMRPERGQLIAFRLDPYGRRCHGHYKRIQVGKPGPGGAPGRRNPGSC